MFYSEKINEKIKKCYLVFLFFLLLIWAARESIDSVPDEKMKYDICNYIFQNWKLPHGGDPAIRNPVWGISYGFTPVLAYMISACFMKGMAVFTDSVFALYLAARFTSVLCMTGMAYFVMKIADRIFVQRKHRWMFIIGITMLPQMVFLGSYINNDSLALLAISVIIYAWLLGIQEGWSVKHCILLGVGIGVCALSYYNAYGYLLTSIFVYFISAYRSKVSGEVRAGILKKALLITGIALLLAGWWFIRSAVIYHGDFLGLRTSDEYAQQFAMPPYKPSNIDNPMHTGESLPYMLITDGWIKSTAVSFIAAFGHADIHLPVFLYLPYAFFVLGGFLGLLKVKASTSLSHLWDDKKTAVLLEWMFLINMFIPIALSIYYSYCSDFQPQGRYIMPMIFPFFYFLVRGLGAVIENMNNRYIQYAVYLVIGIFYLSVPVYSLTLI